MDSRGINLYKRTQFPRAPLPQFSPQPQVMSRHTQHNPDIPMSQLNYPEPGPSRNTNHETHRQSGDFNMRPNRVISGHRQLNTFHKGPRVNFENHADKIVEKMEEEKDLMEDTPISEQLRKEALRDLPQCLTMKRCVKFKLSKSVSQKSKRKPIGFWKSLKYRISISFAKFKSSFNNFNYFELWHGTLKDIEGHFGSGYASYFKFLRWLFVMNFLIALLSFTLVVVPQIMYDATGMNGTLKNTQEFQFQDIFIGNGFLKETVLYYGHYTNTTIELIPHLFFDMPGAYFSVTVVVYLISFLVLAVSVAQSYRRTFIETEGGLQNVYANKIFCGWDYGIATKEAAYLKSSTIFHELKELVSESLQDKINRSCLYKFWAYTIQIVVNILVLIILVAVGWGFWLLLEEFSLKETDSIIVTLVVNAVMIVLPVIFDHISRHEDYNNPRTALYITLIRTYLLGAVIVGEILIFWLTKAGAIAIDCWESHLGAEIYRLILFDFIFSVILTTLIEIVYFVAQKLRGKDPKTEFNIANHTLQIIYNQALFWVGFLYSPILPTIVTIKMLIIWYIREGCVRKFCKPPMKTWRAAQTQTWFMMMIFVSILLIIAVHGYTLKSISTSGCGPLQDYEYMYQIVTNNAINLEQSSLFWEIVAYITKPGVVGLIMIGLGILVYYLKEQAFAQKRKVKLLKEMLAWMGKDKKYLVDWYSDLTKGNYQFLNNRFDDPTQILPLEFGDTVERSNSISKDEFNSRFRKYF